MKIQTLDEIKQEWIDCEHKDWTELIDNGWVFRGLDGENNAIMMRKGYVNLFRHRVTK